MRGECWEILTRTRGIWIAARVAASFTQPEYLAKRSAASAGQRDSPRKSMASADEQLWRAGARRSRTTRIKAQLTVPFAAYSTRRNQVLLEHVRLPIR